MVSRKLAFAKAAIILWPDASYTLERMMLSAVILFYAFGAATFIIGIATAQEGGAE